jgi:Limiting CO2-inducible proteins B/C beta carbonyic anhydrases
MTKKEKLAIIHKVYPGAVTTTDAFNKLIDYIEMDQNIALERVMYADSVCCDDVNTIQSPTRISEFLGPFRIGGLNGYPFVGKTGVEAFLGHVPNDGAAVIFFGPHIGVSKEGKIGFTVRHGQSKPSGCCGAAKKIIDAIPPPSKEGRFSFANDGTPVENDYQFKTLEDIIRPHTNTIRRLPVTQRMQTATMIFYEKIYSQIDHLIRIANWGHCKTIILFGGIIINSDSDMGSFFLQKCIMKLTRKREPEDLMEGYFKQY